MNKGNKFSVDYYGKQYWATYWVEELVIYVNSDYGSGNGSLHEYDQVDIDHETPVPAVLLFRRILDDRFAYQTHFRSSVLENIEDIRG